MGIKDRRPYQNNSSPSTRTGRVLVRMCKMGSLFSRKPKPPRLIKKTKVAEFLSDYNFDFDCLVFEDGGAKGHAYIGALKVSVFKSFNGTFYIP